MYSLGFAHGDLTVKTNKTTVSRLSCNSQGETGSYNRPLSAVFGIKMEESVRASRSELYAP